jgi:hypothetical protein
MGIHTLKYTGKEVDMLFEALSILDGDVQTGDKYTLPSVNNGVLIIDLPLTAYVTGKIVRIKAPQTLTNPKININNLGNVDVNGKIYANNYYNLVYDGTKFLVEQTRVGIDSASIVISTSGTYELNPEISYNVTGIGGGGGSGLGYYSKSVWTAGGGAGGKVIGTISNKSSVTITIGAAGSNHYAPGYEARATGTQGGTTIINNTMYAYGGSGGTCQQNYGGSQGEGGSYSGGTGGAKGANGTSGEYEANTTARNGFSIGGTKYGSGGYMQRYWQSGAELTSLPPQKGVVVLTPIV